RQADSPWRRPPPHRVMGIGDEIHEHLMELMSVRPQWRQPFREIQRDPDAVGAQLVGEHFQGLLNYQIQIHSAALGWTLAREREEIPHDPRAALRRRADLRRARYEGPVLDRFPEQDRLALD